MLQRDNSGNITNYEESKPYLETHGLLDRAIFEQELQERKQSSAYSYKTAQRDFEYILQRHINSRIRAQRSDYHDLPNLYSNEELRRCKVYLGSDWGRSWDQTECAVPDWLNDLYWLEADQHVVLQWKYPIGTMLYSAYRNKVYVVYENDFISSREAAELEEGFDVFGAAGDYSHLRYPTTEEERNQAQILYQAQQGIIGSIEDVHIGVNADYYCPSFILPKEGGSYVFRDSGNHEIVQIPHSFETGYTFTTKQKAQDFLQKHYPTIRLIEWAEFKTLVNQRFF